MAYGTEAGVLYFLKLSSVNTDYFTSANITTAISNADNWVNSINPNATASILSQASSMIAAGELIVNLSLANNDFNNSVSQTNEQPASSPITTNPFYQQAVNLLQLNAKRYYRNTTSTTDKQNYYTDSTY